MAHSTLDFLGKVGGRRTATSLVIATLRSLSHPCKQLDGTHHAVSLLVLTVLAASAALARRLVTAPAIVFLVVGIVLAFVPGFPLVEMKPSLQIEAVLANKSVCSILKDDRRSKFMGSKMTISDPVERVPRSPSSRLV